MFDAVVVGLGAVGSFALRALSKTKHGRYLGLERFGLGHSYGSSHGESRIYRHAYFEHPNYVPWIRHSVAVFRELEAMQNIELLHPSGCLLVEKVEEASASLENLPTICRNSYEAAQEHNIPVKFLDGDQLYDRFPYFRLKDSLRMVGLYETRDTAGMVRCEDAMRAAFVDARTHKGTEIMEHTEVVTYESSVTREGEPIVEMHISQGQSNENRTIRTKSLLIAAGAWTSTLVPDWAPWVVPKRQLQAWMRVNDNDSHNRADMAYGMPSWVWSAPGAYPLPMYGLGADPARQSDTIKFGIHGRDATIYDLTSNPHEASISEVKELREAASVVFSDDFLQACSGPSGSLDFAKVSPCIYTMTPDSNYVIGEPQKGVYCVGGLSGHGFKMAPALGQMLADCSASGYEYMERKWGTDFCSPTRFEK